MVLNARINNGGNLYEKNMCKYVKYFNNKLLSRIVNYYQPNLTQHLFLLNRHWFENEPFD